MPVHPQQFSGKRWTLVYGAYNGPQRWAVNELQRGLQYHLPYVIETKQAATVRPAEAEHLAIIGTPDDNPLLAELIAAGKLARPAQAQGYSIALFDSPWAEGGRVLAIAGADARGVLYGAVEWCARTVGNATLLDGRAGTRKYLDEQPNFAVSEAPAVPRRGIWTWGYVIYDNRRFLDHMARLKMNHLIMWHDEPPLNIAEIIELAHGRGIEVILGFPWGWGFDDELDLTSAEDRAKITDFVLAHYRRYYAGLKHDGIYFQTLTEHHAQELAGRSVAAWACELVNDTARALWADDPGLAIQWGLHATSIRAHYTDLQALDPRMVITWEDAGALPYTYFPQLTAGEETFAGTLDYSRQLATFRPGTTFALVPKGYMCLRWGIEFEHFGPFIQGERGGAYLQERLHERQGELDRVNEEWYRLYPYLAQFYREILAVTPDILAAALVEDGLFDAQIQPAVSLLAETLWNPHQEDRELLARAMRAYYRGS